MTGLYRIGKFADLSGVSSKTLRFYDEIGLLSPASIDARTCHRFYRPEQLEELASIRALKDMGCLSPSFAGLPGEPDPDRIGASYLTISKGGWSSPSKRRRNLCIGS